MYLITVLKYFWGVFKYISKYSPSYVQTTEGLLFKWNLLSYAGNNIIITYVSVIFQSN